MKRCGKCSACCITLAVEEIAKPEGQRCANQCAKGCRIYADRPTSCQGYACAWLLASGWPANLRPDRVGVIVDQAADPNLALALTAAAGDRWCVMREVRPGSARGKAAVTLRERLAAEGLVVVIPFGARRPDQGGVWGPGELISKLLEGPRERQLPEVP